MSLFERKCTRIHPRWSIQRDALLLSFLASLSFGIDSADADLASPEKMSHVATRVNVQSFLP